MRDLTPLMLIAAMACSTEVAPESPERAFAEGYRAAVVVPNADAAGRPELLDPSRWDAVLFDYAQASFDQHLASWSVFKRLDRVRGPYGETVRALRAAGLPEALAAIPYLESTYASTAQSAACARGPWQLMPEVAVRAGLRVEGCTIGGRGEKWTPTDPAPPRPLASGPYFVDGACQILSCDVDERTDLAKSTAASIALLKEAWEDPTLRASGAAVQALITSHNAGFDDARHGRPNRFNVLPAYADWSANVPEDERHLFVGANLKSATPADALSADSVLSPESQHYAYTVLAVHLLASCYYGKNYGEEEAFAPYASAAWCEAFAIPTVDQVQARP